MRFYSTLFCFLFSCLLFAQRDASYTHTQAVNEKINNKTAEEGVKGSPFYYGTFQAATITSNGKARTVMLDYNGNTNEMVTSDNKALLGSVYKEVNFVNKDVWIYRYGQWYFKGEDYYLYPKKKFSQGEAARPGYIQGTRDKYTNMYKFFDNRFEKLKGKRLRELKKIHL